MDEAEAFVRRYIETEHRALQAVLVEEDDLVAMARERDAKSMLAPDVTLPFGRPLGLSSAEKEVQRRGASQFVPRTLFVLRRYAHAEYGMLFEAIVSSDEADASRSYFDAFYVASLHGELRIVARYARTESSGHVGWYPASGADLGALGTPMEVRWFEPPAISSERADWEREA